MLRSTVFPAPYNSAPVLSRTHTCHSRASTRVIFPRSSFVSGFHLRQFRQPRLKSLPAVRTIVPASAKKQRRGSTGVAGIDAEEDDDDDDEEEEGEEDEDMVPLENMKNWLEKKPKGFGEGKEYDTSIEDKLLEEIRLSKEAQATNLKKLKANPVNPASKNNDQEKKDVNVVSVGCRVRLVNLPKKKNIERDLKAAFQGIPGIANIVPAVTGNKKTRDPVCKGFAFVDFKHEKDAVRFIELYTGQTITFGKIQKQIKCELVNAESSSSSPQLSKNLNNALPLLVSAYVEDSDEEDSNMNDSALGSWDGTTLDEQYESERENQEFATAMEVDFDDSIEMGIDSKSDSLPSDHVNGNHIAEQKPSAKVRQENAPKKKPTSQKNVKKVLDVPGSAKRLKVKEKAVLTDVFSKYRSKAALASKDR